MLQGETLSVTITLTGKIKWHPQKPQSIYKLDGEAVNIFSPAKASDTYQTSDIHCNYQITFTRLRKVPIRKAQFQQMIWPTADVI